MFEQLMWTDYILLIVIFISTILSIRKGFFEQICSIACLVIAILVAINFSDEIADIINALFGPETVTATSAMAASFFVIFLGLSKISKFIIAHFKGDKLGLVDRLLGILFGFVRGVFFAVIFVALGLFSPYVKSDDWLKTPVTIGLQPLSETLLSFVPDEIEEMIQGQIKDLDRSPFVNQTKKLFNVTLDADLEVYEDEDEEDEQGLSEEEQQEQEKTEQDKKLEMQKTRLYKEALENSRPRELDLQFPGAAQSEGNDRLFQDSSRKSDRRPDSVRDVLIERQKQLNELKNSKDLED